MNATLAASIRDHNVPGDGKFDNTRIPGDSIIAVRRVDMYDLPYFDETETELLRRYLIKPGDLYNKKFTTVE